jgi:glycosyltransferase involved in cell wall biosynthesis
MKLSILMPVYNERTVVERCVEQVLAAPLPEQMDRELIIVDDCSSDGTWAILNRIAEGDPRVRLFRHTVNQGKGASVRDAVQHATGDFAIIQDADLEYDPSEYSRLLKPLLSGHADAVFGSRYLAGEQMRVLPYWHSKINWLLTLVSNMFSNLKLTDMETCYKVFRTDLLKSIPIRSNRFGIEPEITMKAAKRRLRIYEVPISYHGRSYEEGKKIGWKDGLRALGAIFHFWLIDDLYSEPYGRGLLNNLTGTPQYLAWIAGTIQPHLGDRVLELGAGIGHITARLMSRRLLYVAAERDPLYLHALKNRFLRTPNVRVMNLNAEAPFEWRVEETFDTALCLNVLEFVHDPEATVAELVGLLKPGGQLVVLVPQGPGLFSPIDRTLGAKRRFARGELKTLLERHGLEVEKSRHLNKIGTLSWFFYGRLLRRPSITKLWLKLFDKTVWLWRRVDPVLPWPGLSLIAVARKPVRAEGSTEAETGHAQSGVVSRV